MAVGPESMRIYTKVQIIYVVNVQLKRHLNRRYLNKEYHLGNVNGQGVQQPDWIVDVAIDGCNRENKNKIKIGIFVGQGKRRRNFCQLFLLSIISYT